MTGYSSPVDIANRALQLCGASRITAFTDNDKNAASVAFVYDKIRQSELRRNVWSFSIRQAIVRALADDTLLLVAPTWAAGAYTAGAIVSSLNTLWIASVNTSGVPGTSPDWLTYAGPLTVSTYDATEEYEIGELVKSGGTVYLSITGGNAVAPPSAGWIAPAGLTTSTLTLFEPLTTNARYLFRLPANFLRNAPDPKTGAYGVLGGPAWNGYLDRNLQGQYISSSDPSAVSLRFAADIQDVAKFDPLFCEGLALRIALAIVEELTQSNTKLSTLAQMYTKFMGEARQVNAIEVGPTEANEDDFIVVRR